MTNKPLLRSYFWGEVRSEGVDWLAINQGCKETLLGFTCVSNVTKVLETSFLKEDVIERRILTMTFFDFRNQAFKPRNVRVRIARRMPILLVAQRWARLPPCHEPQRHCQRSLLLHGLTLPPTRWEGEISAGKNRSAFTSDREYLTGPYAWASDLRKNAIHKALFCRLSNFQMRRQDTILGPHFENFHYSKLP